MRHNVIPRRARTQKAKHSTALILVLVLTSAPFLLSGSLVVYRCERGQWRDLA